MKVIFILIVLLVFSLDKMKCEAISEREKLSDIDNIPILSSEYRGNRVWFVNRTNQNLFFTKNGGESWQELSGNSLNGFGKISFLDENKGWAFCGKNNIWETNDGGQTWKYLSQLSEPDDERIIPRRMKFISKKLGWLTDMSGRLWYTNDGGVKWSVKSIWRNYNVEIFGLSLIDEKEGWLACDKGLALKTIDGGTTWNLFQLPSHSSVYEIQFIDKKNGWVLIGKNVFHTPNGGESWHGQLSFKSFFEGPILNSIFFLDKRTGWAVGYDNPYSEKRTSATRIGGIIYQTIDGGDSWKIQKQNAFEEEIFELNFSNQKQGWLITSKNIYKTDDGGKAWKIVFRFP